MGALQHFRASLAHYAVLAHCAIPICYHTFSLVERWFSKFWPLHNDNFFVKDGAMQPPVSYVRGITDFLQMEFFEASNI